MSTSLLYHAWGLQGYRYRRTDYHGEDSVFAVELNADTHCCSSCGNRSVMGQGYVTRHVKSILIGLMPLTIVLSPPRLWCAECCKIRQARVRFADTRRSCTRAFQRYALELYVHMTIQAVARDMSPAYRSAIEEHLPHTAHVLDRFHVIKLYNDHLSELGRQIQLGSVTEHKRAIKVTRWLLLKNPENLDDHWNERQRVEEALRLNHPLACAYYMKEGLRGFWNQPDIPSGQRILDDRVARAEVSGIRMLQKFSRTMQNHRHDLLAWSERWPIFKRGLAGGDIKRPL